MRRGIARSLHTRVGVDDVGVTVKRVVKGSGYTPQNEQLVPKQLS